MVTARATREPSRGGSVVSSPSCVDWNGNRNDGSSRSGTSHDLGRVAAAFLGRTWGQISVEAAAHGVFRPHRRPERRHEKRLEGPPGQRDLVPATSLYRVAASRGVLDAKDGPGHVEAISRPIRAPLGGCALAARPPRWRRNRCAPPRFRSLRRASLNRSRPPLLAPVRVVGVEPTQASPPALPWVWCWQHGRTR